MKFILIVFLFLMLMSWVFPRLVRWMFRMFLNDQFNKAQQTFHKDSQTKKPVQKNTGYKGGDYVDYEEVKE